jgi:2-polyprenyl-3-methyl-5-hydroxy-6-metoxy-1,4-benzoquinol methylase
VLCLRCDQATHDSARETIHQVAAVGDAACRETLRRRTFILDHITNRLKAEQASVPAIATWIRLTLRRIRVVDIGCGPSHLIEAFHRGGIDVLGLDYSAAARGFVSKKGLPFETLDPTTRG